MYEFIFIWLVSEMLLKCFNLSHHLSIFHIDTINNDEHQQLDRIKCWPKAGNSQLSLLSKLSNLLIVAIIYLNTLSIGHLTPNTKLSQTNKETISQMTRLMK